MAERPGFAATVIARKIALFWSDFEMPDAWDMFLLARYSPVLWLPLLGMGLLLPFAAIGAVAASRRSREARLLVGYSVIYSASVVAFFVFSRYRLHVVPALAVLAASSLPWLGEQIRLGQVRPLVACRRRGRRDRRLLLQGQRHVRDGASRESSGRNQPRVALQAERRAPAGVKLLLETLERQEGAGRAGPLCALGDLHRQGRGSARRLGARGVRSRILGIPEAGLGSASPTSARPGSRTPSQRSTFSSALYRGTPSRAHISRGGCDTAKRGGLLRSSKGSGIKHVAFPHDGFEADRVRTRLAGPRSAS